MKKRLSIPATGSTNSSFPGFKLRTITIPPMDTSFIGSYWLLSAKVMTFNCCLIALAGFCKISKFGSGSFFFSSFSSFFSFLSSKVDVPAFLSSGFFSSDVAAFFSSDVAAFFSSDVAAFFSSFSSVFFSSFSDFSSSCNTR